MPKLLNRENTSRAIVVALIVAAATLFHANPRVAVAAPPDGHDVTLADAMRVIDAAIKKAQTIDTKMNIAVMDAGGNLKAFVRMDGAYLGSIDIAIKKAKTARYFDAPTGVLGTMTQPGGPLYGLEGTSGGLVTFAGGLPLKNAAGAVIGSIGVSGSSVDNDLAVAEAGAAAF